MEICHWPAPQSRLRILRFVSMATRGQIGRWRCILATTHLAAILTILGGERRKKTPRIVKIEEEGFGCSVSDTVGRSSMMS